MQAADAGPIRTATSAALLSAPLSELEIAEQTVKVGPAVLFIAREVSDLMRQLLLEI